MKTQLPDDMQEALEKVLDYLWQDEKRDYDSAPAEGREGHIFESLRLLRDLLENANR